LTMSNCTIQTLCTTLSEYEQYLVSSTPKSIQVSCNSSRFFNLLGRWSILMIKSSCL
jgi:hypothetical protein